jgi:hypothetical protein
MANAMFLNLRGTGGGTMELPATNGRMAVNHNHALERQLLPTDPIGSMTLTLTNIVPGSTYDVEVLSTGNQVVTPGTAAGSSVVLTIPVYISGSVNNSLRIKVRKGSSSPYYQPYETQVTAAVGSQSLFINQLSDE